MVLGATPPPFTPQAYGTIAHASGKMWRWTGSFWQPVGSSAIRGGDNPQVIAEREAEAKRKKAEAEARRRAEAEARRRAEAERQRKIEELRQRRQSIQQKKQKELKRSFSPADFIAGATHQVEASLGISPKKTTVEKFATSGKTVTTRFYETDVGVLGVPVKISKRKEVTIDKPTRAREFLPSGSPVFLKTTLTEKEGGFLLVEPPRPKTALEQIKTAEVTAGQIIERFPTHTGELAVGKGAIAGGLGLGFFTARSIFQTPQETATEFVKGTIRYPSTVVRRVETRGGVGLFESVGEFYTFKGLGKVGSKVTSPVTKRMFPAKTKPEISFTEDVGFFETIEGSGKITGRVVLTADVVTPFTLKQGALRRLGFAQEPKIRTYQTVVKVKQVQRGQKFKGDYYGVTATPEKTPIGVYGEFTGRTSKLKTEVVEFKTPEHTQRVELETQYATARGTGIALKKGKIIARTKSDVGVTVAEKNVLDFPSQKTQFFEIEGSGIYTGKKLSQKSFFEKPSKKIDTVGITAQKGRGVLITKRPQKTVTYIEGKPSGLNLNILYDPVLKEVGGGLKSVSETGGLGAGIGKIKGSISEKISAIETKPSPLKDVNIGKSLEKSQLPRETLKTDTKLGIRLSADTLEAVRQQQAQRQRQRLRVRTKTKQKNVLDTKIGQITYLSTGQRINIRQELAVRQAVKQRQLLRQRQKTKMRSSIGQRFGLIPSFAMRGFTGMPALTTPASLDFSLEPKKKKKSKKRKKKFMGIPDIFPRSDILSLTITEIRTGRRASHPYPTPAIKKAYAKVLREDVGFYRFPTAQQLRRAGKRTKRPRSVRDRLDLKIRRIF